MEPNGLLLLRADEAAALHRLDRTFTEWGIARGAEPVVGPALLPVAGLAKLGYYQNFPHQALTVSGLNPDRRPRGEAATATTAFPPDQLLEAAVAPPPANCYAVYLGMEGTELERNTLVTLVGRCFRREERYTGLRRLLGFHMRETVALGSEEFVEKHLERSSQRILAFAEALGLDIRKEPASDPFDDGEGPHGEPPAPSPVKHAFRVGGLSIASVNTHRAFFGERCDIRAARTGRPVFTGCVAFGLERWLAVLHERHGDWAAIATALDKAAVT